MEWHRQAYIVTVMADNKQEGKCVSVEIVNTAGRLAKKAVIPAVLFLGILAAVAGCSGQDGKGAGARDTLGMAMLVELAGEAADALYDTFVPCFSYVREGSHETYWILQQQVESLLPFYGYLSGEVREEARTILLEEAREGEETTLGILVWGEEGNAQTDSHGSNAQADGAGSGMADGLGDGTGENGEAGVSGTDHSLADLLRTENEAAMQMWQGNGSLFIPHSQVRQVDLESLRDYETLVKTFYTVDSNTMAGSDQLNVEKLLARDMTLVKDDTAGPQILIYHTHSQEAFADSVPGDRNSSIVGVGERLTRILTDTYGYQVMHHTGEYDVGSRNDAYARSLPEIERILEENPSIEVVIDLHRDAMPEGTRLVVDLDGRPTARFMFFNGLSRTRKTGNISYLYNENLSDNLAFSFQMEKKAMEYYPGLTRKIYLKGYRYNMHLAPRYLLIELGAQNNTVEEAMNACDPLAHILDLVLSGQ